MNCSKCNEKKAEAIIEGKCLCYGCAENIIFKAFPQATSLTGEK